ncbi:MAG: diaminopimelate epimerase [Gemmatimonadota bacterium]
MHFSKLSGAGNDFVVLDAADVETGGAPALARSMCDRVSGIGADGLILVAPSGSGLSARFFNPDGTEFSTCGNGTRCVARYGQERGWVGSDPFDIVTEFGTVRVTTEGGHIRLEYPLRIRVRREVEAPERGWLVDVGLPHFVVPVDRLPGGSIVDRCAAIRGHPEFGPEGTNVNLVQILDAGTIRIRTFERGVEGETLACGSGAMACAVALHGAGLCRPDVRVGVRGGGELVISFPPFEPPERGPEPPVRLSGPVSHILDGEYPA